VNGLCTIDSIAEYSNLEAVEAPSSGERWSKEVEPCFSVFVVILTRQENMVEAEIKHSGKGFAVGNLQ
jgi:hypothetical protein